MLWVTHTHAHKIAEDGCENAPRQKPERKKALFFPRCVYGDKDHKVSVAGRKQAASYILYSGTVFTFILMNLENKHGRSVTKIENLYR